MAGPDWRRVGIVSMVAAVWVGATTARGAPPPAARGMDCAAMEAFLRTARIVRQREIPVGVTHPVRATLDNGVLRHDAAIQTTNVRQPVYQTDRGTELNFRDSWMFNVAGYELARMLDLNMVPPYVERRVAGAEASVSWWVNDAMMERDRLLEKVRPPDVERWNREMHAVRLFHELIADRDINATNILITRDWRAWMIDFSRAFRRTRVLERPDSLRMVDPRLLANLRALTRANLRQRLARWLDVAEIDAVLERRTLIVRRFEESIAAQGEASVFYHLPRVGEPCGSGLD